MLIKELPKNIVSPEDLHLIDDPFTIDEWCLYFQRTGYVHYTKQMQLSGLSTLSKGQTPLSHYWCMKYGHVPVLSRDAVYSICEAHMHLLYGSSTTYQDELIASLQTHWNHSDKDFNWDGERMTRCQTEACTRIPAYSLSLFYSDEVNKNQALRLSDRSWNIMSMFGILQALRIEQDHFDTKW